eukprot:366565-Chlamydomonas_euryale.AAC.15
MTSTTHKGFCQDVCEKGGRGDARLRQGFGSYATQLRHTPVTPRLSRSYGHKPWVSQTNTEPSCRYGSTRGRGCDTRLACCKGAAMTHAWHACCKGAAMTHAWHACCKGAARMLQ